MNETTKIRKSEPASTEAVSFTDGMLVTADDMQAAMNYPLSVVQVLLRSYLGCGIVCGFEVTDAFAGKRPAAKPECAPDPRWKVKIAPGVALGCDAYPIELCGKMELDLAPDPCGCPISAPVTRFIAVKRERASETSPRGGCGCGGCGCSSCSGEPGQQCTRQRDHILVGAFDSAPKGACMRKPKPAVEMEGGCPPDDKADDGKQVSDSLCQCLSQCSTCDRCAEPWVVIAVLQIDENGIVDGSIGKPTLVDEVGGPIRIKPIECHCSSERMAADRLEKLEERMKTLEDNRKLKEAQKETKPGDAAKDKPVP